MVKLTLLPLSVGLSTRSTQIFLAPTMNPPWVKMTWNRRLMLGKEVAGEANGMALEKGAELLMKASKMTVEEVRALLNQFSADEHDRIQGVSMSTNGRLKSYLVV